MTNDVREVWTALFLAILIAVIGVLGYTAIVRAKMDRLEERIQRLEKTVECEASMD